MNSMREERFRDDEGKLGIVQSTRYPSQSEYLLNNKVRPDQTARPAIASLYFGLNFTATSNLSHPGGWRNAGSGL